MVTEQAAKEMDAMRGQVVFAMNPGEKPDAEAMGAESAEYVAPSIDPQWMWAWKIFDDHEGEYESPSFCFIHIFHFSFSFTEIELLTCNLFFLT